MNALKITPPPPLQKSQRIDYIDAIKGFTILWVCVFHLCHAADWVEVSWLPMGWMEIGWRMPLFFFVSGFLFRSRPFGEFMRRRVNSLLVPFVFFYALAAALVLVNFGVLNNIVPSLSTGMQTKAGMWSLKEAFSPWLHVNGALWFLIALFNINLIYWTLRRWIPLQWAVFAVCAVAWASVKTSIFGDNFFLGGSWLEPLFVAETFKFLPFLALGDMFGRRLVDFISPLGLGRRLLMLGTLVLLLIIAMVVSLSDFVINEFVVLLFIPAVFVFFGLLCDYAPVLMRPLRWFGRNSLVVLGTHMVIFNISRPIFRILSIDAALVPWCKLAILFPATWLAVWLLGKYVPWAVGKKDLI